MKLLEVLREGEEEFLPYADHVATKLARQFLAGAKGDVTAAKRVSEAFWKSIDDAIDKESRFVGAKLAGSGNPEESQPNRPQRSTGYDQMRAVDPGQSRGYV